MDEPWASLRLARTYPCRTARPLMQGSRFSVSGARHHRHHLCLDSLKPRVRLEPARFLLGFGIEDAVNELLDVGKARYVPVGTTSTLGHGAFEVGDELVEWITPEAHHSPPGSVAGRSLAAHGAPSG